MVARLAILVLILAGCLPLVGCGQAGHSTSSNVSSTETPAGSIDGASRAVCSPARCLPPPGHTIHTLSNVSNDDGTAATRQYAAYRPAGLHPSRRNRAPAILVFYGGGNCGLHPPPGFISLAAKDRFVVVAMEVPCGRVPAHWEKKFVDSTTTTTPDDEPYVSAVVNDLTTCPSRAVGPNQCIDPGRIYAAGLSSGGSLVSDIMCDPQNSPRFRGYLIDSSTLQLFNGAPHCPSTNRNYFVMMATGNYGADSLLYYDTGPNPHLDVPRFADWAARHLGCRSRRIDDAIGSPLASTLRYTYRGPCAYAAAGSAAVITLGIRNGGHGWGCQDSGPTVPENTCPGMPNPPGRDARGQPRTNGLVVERAFWNLVSRGRSVATPGSRS